MSRAEVNRDALEVVGARTHNLKDVSVGIPLERCVLVVGPSGSGKSSLAFGTIHGAAHAAYLEGISSYARFTETRLASPEVDAIHNLRPTLALAQGYGGRSSRSTVGTVTDALALLRVLFSRLGHPERTAGQLSLFSPESVCDTCHGAGNTLTPVVGRLLDPKLTLREGALQHRAWKVGGRYWNILEATGQVPLDVPAGELTASQQEFVLESPSFEVSNRNPGFVQRFTYEGVVPRLRKRVGDARDLDGRSYDLSFFDQRPCPACGGTRLSAAVRDVTIAVAKGQSVSYGEMLQMELPELLDFVRSLNQPIAGPIVRRVGGLLDRMIEMGLGHLTMLRSTATLSGGELRRVRIAHQLVSPLNGLMYVVDEAGAGLHHEEARAVYGSLRTLRDAGNTLLLVDHSDGAREIADHIVELGPGGGTQGGQLVWSGPADEYDGPYGTLPALRRRTRDPQPGSRVWMVQARSNNLHAAEVAIPKQRFVVLVGPSGAGKSSLARDIAAQVPQTALLSQRDIGGSVRSVLATYLKVFDRIRKLFGDASGRPAGDFSFNGAGACPACGGWGYQRMDMQFLEDVTTVCEECRGGRYRPELLGVRLHGCTIAEVLALTVDEAADLFSSDPAIAGPLGIAAAVGLGHLVIGQSTDTLSGGEAQRLRISTEVAQPQRKVERNNKIDKRQM